MEKINVMLDDIAFEPKRAHASDAGLDILSPSSYDIPRNGSCVIDTGVHVEIPNGYVGFLKSKSGLNIKHGITCEGVIDAGYTGSIVCKFYNHSNDTDYHFDRCDKLVQLVILPIETPEINIVDAFLETERGDSGFGSTGK